MYFDKFNLKNRGNKNLGQDIAKATNNKLYQAKKNQRTPKSLNGNLPTAPRINTSPVPAKPRHRKYFGIVPPNTAY